MLETKQWMTGLLCCLICLGCLVPTVTAESEDAKLKLRQIRKNFSEVSRLIKKNKFEEAESLLDQSEQAVAQWQTDSGFSDNHRTVKGLKKVLNARREFLAKRRGVEAEPQAADQIVFSKTILPLLKEHCFDCHGEEGEGELRLDTAEGLRKGGKSGRAIVPKNSRGSILMQRMVTGPPQSRMPKGKPGLPREQLKLFDQWIMQGAVLDVKSGSFMGETEENRAEAQVFYATGTETVSFKKNIAPFMVRLCGSCHNDQQKRGGLSISTFRNLMRGGKSGVVLIPGELEKSRLFRLAGGLELPRMPNNDSRLTRKNYEDLKKWIQEGVKYDGGDPDALLTSIVPTEEDLLKSRLAAMSAQELEKYRDENAVKFWRRAASSQEMNTVRTNNFIVYSDLEEKRLQQTARVAEEQLKFLKQDFGDKSPATWKGKLSVFLAKNSFVYDEFATLLNQQKTEEYSAGIVQIKPDQSSAFVVLSDSPDEQTELQPGFEFQVRQLISIAFLERGGVSIPPWFARGYSQHLALKSTESTSEDSPWVSGHRSNFMKQSNLIKKRLRGQIVLTQNEFLSPAELDMIGFEVIRYLIKVELEAKLPEYLNLLRSGVPAEKGVQMAFQKSIGRLEKDLYISSRRR